MKVAPIEGERMGDQWRDGLRLKGQRERKSKGWEEKALFGSKTHLIGHVLLILFVGISTTRIA